MYFIKLLIEYRGEYTHFCFASEEYRVDAHLILSSEFQEVLKSEPSTDWVGTEEFRVKLDSQMATVRIKISERNFVYYKVTQSSYTEAINAYLAEIGGL